MSDYKLAPQYDTSKNITGIEVHTNYIAGLDLILLHYFTSIVPNPATLKDTFAKFEKIVVDQDKSIILEDYEQQIYTLFSLQQLFKAKAKEQNLIIDDGRIITEQEMTESLKSGNLDDNQIQSILNLTKQPKKSS